MARIIDNGDLTNFTIATDVIGGEDYQLVKVAAGNVGSTTPIEGSAAFGLEVDPTRLPPLVAGSALIGQVQLTDGTDVATVSVAGSRKPLDIHLIDSAGNIVSSFGGAGGTSATDDADFTRGSTPGTPIMGVYESVQGTTTDGDLGIFAMDANGRLRVSVDASALDVSHDAVDSGAPVKVGSRAKTSLPTPVADNDRVNAIADLFGRLLTAHIAPEMQVWKRFRYTTTQGAGAAASIWDPTSGKRIAITHIIIGTGGTTTGRLILFFADNADLTYTEGTDQLVFDHEFKVTSTGGPGAVVPLPTPIFCSTVDRELKAQTDTTLTVAGAVYGYEW